MRISFAAELREKPSQPAELATARVRAAADQNYPRKKFQKRLATSLVVVAELSTWCHSIVERRLVWHPADVPTRRFASETSKPAVNKSAVLSAGRTGQSEEATKQQHS